ncbi:gliding motility-associated C-terminal domain-containing protein [Mucilaginibacter litoreus]|uniref:Gliding motility-associated C-terminal domain-containing protein n=1 Tax=Mucilaginibacter litoreus TaxID=1048221 RepID=A0ABW3ARQ5_9SPHI
MKKLIILVLFFSTISTYAQKQGNIWYFGSNAGVNFNTSPPTALTDGQISTWEGCATIANDDGNLLFYTDGITVYTKNHTVMENGYGLYGDPSSTQSGVIIPHPTNKNLYYVFTVALQGGSLYYSIVDISKQSGYGEVIEKNNKILDLSTEKITAVKHKNGTDMWVIAHEYLSNKFYAYLITKDGFQPTPVITAVGSVMGMSYTSTIGYLKASPKGTKLAAAVYFPDKLTEVYDFDKGTGVVSNPVTLTNFNGFGAYGVEFSPNEKFLYITEHDSGIPCNLYQVKLPVTSGDIKDRSVSIAKLDGFGALQLASDGKIYVDQVYSQYLHAIEEPNEEGAKSKFKENAIYLEGRTCTYGLPTFNQSFFAEVGFSNSGQCLGDITTFKLKSSVSNIDSVRWNFGDAASGNKNSSKQQNPTHLYEKAGTYNVTVNVYYQGTFATYSNSVNVYELPVVSLGNDTTLFYGQSLLLDAGNPGSIYKWSDGSTQRTLLVKSPGTYIVQLTSPTGCGGADTINVHYDQVINVGLKADTTICVGETIQLNVALPGASYLWSDGSTNSSITVNQTGKYWVKITNAYQNRVKTDTITVKHYQFSSIGIVSDTILCEPQLATITATGAKSGETYSWFDSNKTFLENNNGTFHTGLIKTNTNFYVQLTNGKCVGDMRKVSLIFDKPVATIVNKDTIIVLGSTVKLNGKGGKYYHWEPALYLDDTDIPNPVSAPGDDITYQLIVLNDNGCTDTATVKILVRKQVSIPNTFTPNGDGVNDTWTIRYIDRLPDNQVYIYSRQGSLIRNFRNYSNTWDGTGSNGQPLPAGVYYYVIYLDKNTRQSGYITIIR